MARRVRSAAAQRRRPVLEAVGQWHIVQLARSLGGKEYVLGTRRSRGRPCPTCQTFVPEHQGTRQTEGVCDVLIFLPAPRALRPHQWTGEPVNPTRGTLVMVECKAQGGKRSAEQDEFRDWCLRCEVAHVTGGLDDFLAWLVNHGYIRADTVPHYRRQVTRRERE